MEIPFTTIPPHKKVTPRAILFTDDQWTQIRALAEQHNLSRSAVVRHLVDQALRSTQETNP